MPWICPSCQLEQQDYISSCPECALAKTNWTVIEDRTRAFVIPARRRFVLRRGTRSAPVPASQPEPTLSLLEAAQITCVPKEQAREWSSADQRPPTAQLLFVVEYPQRKTKQLDVRLELLFASQPSTEQSVPVEAPADLGPDDPVVVPLLFVFGADDDLSDLAFEGVELVDLSEGEGYAPSVEVSALGKEAQELPVGPARARRPVWSL